MNDIILRDTETTRWGRPIFELLKPVRYEFRTGGPYVFAQPGLLRMEVEVPAGFLTDFASIPRPFWSVLPPYGPWRRAAIVHDYLYSVGCPRFIADAIFRHIMQQTPGIKTWQRVVMYYAVRLYSIFSSRVGADGAQRG